jgi:hypothetical protein
MGLFLKCTLIKGRKKALIFHTTNFNRSEGSLSEQIFSREAYLEHRDLEIFPLTWGSDDFAWLQTL